MNESAHTRIECSHCGKQLRLKNGLKEKRLKCPSCSHFIQSTPPIELGDCEEREDVSKERKKTWVYVTSAGLTLSVVAVLMFLWLNAKSGANELRDKLATAEQKAQGIDELINDLSISKKALEQGMKDSNQVRQLEKINTSLKNELEMLKKNQEQGLQDANQVKQMEKTNTTLKAEVEKLTEELGSAKRALAFAQEIMKKETPPKKNPVPDTKVVESIATAVLNDFPKRLVYIPAIGDDNIQINERAPVLSMDTRKVVGYFDGKQMVSPTAKNAEHKIDGKVVATTTHVIERMKGQDGFEYSVYIKNGVFKALARSVQGAPDQLLYLVRD